MERIRDQPYLKRILRVLRMEYNFADLTKHTVKDVELLIKSFGLKFYAKAMLNEILESL